MSKKMVDLTDLEVMIHNMEVAYRISAESKDHMLGWVRERAEDAFTFDLGPAQVWELPAGPRRIQKGDVYHTWGNLDGQPGDPSDEQIRKFVVNGISAMGMLQLSLSMPNSSVDVFYEPTLTAVDLPRAERLVELGIWRLFEAQPEEEK